MAEKNRTLQELNGEVKKLKEDIENQKSISDYLNKQNESLKFENYNINNDIKKQIVEWAAHNRKSGVVKFLLSQLEMPENVEKKEIKTVNLNINNNCDSETIFKNLYTTLLKAGRNITKDDIYNYLISVAQNYIIVLAGEPGTGKTSFCKLLAKSLGVYNSRFSEILVEKGWTSSRDLIGYYNPLTKEIEETQPSFSRCMKQLDYENKSGEVRAPYFVLLDEANLSPIEYYWSNFNYYCDNSDNQVVEYANGVQYKFGSELKFLATINYDQTTADLSPRFLDRAWVISMSLNNLNLINMIDENDIENNEFIVSLEALKNSFDLQDKSKELKINPVTKTRLDKIINIMKSGGHLISARSLKAIYRYYVVAEKYMSSKECALDYAVAQKILPIISGNGHSYGGFLNELMNICKENQLNKSANIVSNIISHEEHGFYGFFSL